MHVAAPRIMTPFGMMFPNPDGPKFNASHTISHLSFGPEFPNMVFPMNGHACPHTEGIAMYQYHIKVVPTVYESLSGRVMDTNQFSASDFTQELVGVRGWRRRQRTRATRAAATERRPSFLPPATVCRRRLATASPVSGFGTTLAPSWCGSWRRGTACWR